MATSEADVAAKLIERLLVDPAFRARFRRNPAEACREAGLDELAQEMSIGAGKAMMTLDLRESKSSLAGVMMAAAMEGVGVMQFVEHVAPHLDDIPEAIGDVLSRVNLPAIGGALAPSPSPSAPAAAPEGGAAGADGVAGADPGVDTAAAGNGAAPVAAAPVAAPPADAPATPEAAAAAKAPEEPAAAKPEPKTAAEQAAEKIAKEESPETKTAEAGQKAADDIAEDAKDLPSATDLPDDNTAPKPSVDVGGEPKAAAPAAPATPEQAAAAPPAAAAPVAAAAPADPAAVRAAPAHDHAAEEAAGHSDAPDTPPPATSGSVEAAAKALLENKNLVLDADAQKDVRSGDVDPRMIALLGKLTEKHKIELSVIKTGHAQFSAGGSVSNHFVGRGIDIATVDGEIVRPNSAAARELASEIAEMSGNLRPTEVGTPWAIAASGFFTDGAHQDHLHVAYDGEPPKGFEIPASKGAPAPAAAVDPAAAGAAPVAAAAAVPAAPGAPVAAAAAPPVPKAGDSGQFLAPKPADLKKSDSGQFMAAAQPQPAAAAAAAPPGAADAAAAAADLSGVSGDYPGDDAPKEQLAAWLGKEAEKRGLPPELPVMAALVESGVKNLNFGDADSVGFFQMRVGIWNQGEYEGFPEKPELQAKWFLDTAEQVKKQRISRGQPVDDPSQFGEWIADIERPAEQYRGRYQLRLDEAKGLLDKASKSAPAAPAAPAVDPAATPAAVQPGAVADAAAGTGSSADGAAGALLENKNIVLDADAQKDVRGGDVDPRMIALLTKLSDKHKIELSVIKTGHDQFTSGGSVSNHFLGRGIDIARVDGEIVNPGSAAARELASEIAEMSGDLRPTEVGSPWAISASGFFTDGAHQDHLHVAYDGEPPAGFKAPVANAAAAAAAPAAAAPAAPGSPVAAAAAVPEPPKAGDSGQFLAAKADSATPKKGDSGAFMAVRPVGPASALADPAAVPGAVDAAAAAAPGSGSSTLGAAALKTAETQLGVKEEGTNTGAKVDAYLEAAGVPPGNPWCASFVTWALAQNGHKMEGGGWAAVQTWVRNAEAGNNDLQIVSAEDARPGDIVTYDWGGQEDFGADGHIGFLKSEVKDGKFTALEGNNQDAVMNVPRQTTGANVKFIRIGGDAPPAAPAAGVAPAATPGSGAGVADVAAAAGGSGGSGGYPGDNASKAQLAAWLGREAEKRGLPKQLPVMAALVESGVKNLNYGDADSVGFFQMRVGIWNKGEYAGFPEKPELQAKWFLDTAEQVKKQRIARGQSVTDPKQFGEWIADIERPAAQYRSRYGMRLGEANSLLGQAGAAPAAVEQVAAAPAAPAAAADAAAAAVSGGGGGAGPKALAALKEAQKYTGTAYKWGGSTPQTGFDCSGLVQWAYAKAGVQLPRVTDAQFAAGNGKPVGRDKLVAGDLVFFGKPGNIYHVGISMGGDKFLHAPKTGDVVKVASLDDSYFSQNFAGGRRFDEASGAASAAAVPAAPVAGAAAAPAIDPKAVAEAQAAVARDAAEVNRGNSGLFMAVKAQEERRHKTVQFMKAIDPKEAKAAAAPAVAAAAAPADAVAPAAAPPAAVEPSGTPVDAGEPIQLPDDISDDYPGNNASKDELAKWLAKQADKHGLPPELPVMASLVESGVKNLNFGDADSVGFFQMRVGIWNQGAYKGYPEHPELQAKWFIDQALAVKKQAIARGDADFGKDPSKWGEWIADIERPAEQYRGRYQLRLKEARGLLS